MSRNKLLTSMTLLAIFAATPVLAAPGGGGGGGGHGGGGHGGGAGGMGGMGHGQGNAFGHGNSFGHGNTSIDAGRITGSRIIDRSAMGIGSSTKLTGVNTGMPVLDGGGVAVGTVTHVATKGNGSVHHVMITLNNGEVVTLKPRSLTLNDGVLTTSSLTSNFRANSRGAAHASVQGLAHASPRSALGGAGITTLSGLTLGMAVMNNGTSLGPVTQLINNRSGALVGIRVALVDGGIVTIPARTLALNGGVLTTTFVPK